MVNAGGFGWKELLLGCVLFVKRGISEQLCCMYRCLHADMGAKQVLCEMTCVE